MGEPTFAARESAFGIRSARWTRLVCLVCLGRRSVIESATFDATETTKATEATEETEATGD
ncbi:hypothetical protein [Embleya sp. NPDC050493]|uniref:hypothetical protein n=1 Tax=Embleya sp. NPDC050493 TaxID=3363989 RepID=UPI0037A04ADD